MRIARKSPVDRSLAYVDRVNRAIDYILQHLDAPLRLEVVAQAAGFSPFHVGRPGNRRARAVPLRSGG